MIIMVQKKLLLTCLLSSPLIFGQTVNEGGLYIKPNTEVSTLFSFENKESAQTFNNGTIYFYGDFINNGLYDFQSGAKTHSKAIFTSDKKQTIEGKNIANFYHVVFDNSTKEVAFDLLSGMSSEGEVVFQIGIVKLYSDDKSFAFLKGSKALNASDASHVEGWIDKIGNDEFTFPEGDKGLYRFAKISAPKNVKDVFASRYILEDKDFFATRSGKAGVVENVNTNEYWELNRMDNSEGSIILTLSWDERTTPQELLENAEENLHIVRWDERQEMWVDEGGIVDVGSRTITSPATVKGFGYFTLATVKTDWLLDGDVVVYNFVSPDGDGKNDYFLVDNINRFPNNKVEIYNRWGTRVFETSNYDNNGNGTTNVFTGFTDGRVINKNKPLPTGTYFYIISYEYSDDNGSRMIKKSGYLHLESN
jgi:gliding motility-associated-like protein